MLSLVDATAYIVEYVKRVGKLDKLGKMKLFKILYLADWERFKDLNEPLLGIRWYRIQKGPALKPNDWQELLTNISNKYNITSSWENYGNYTQVVFSINKPIKVKITPLDRKYLQNSIKAVIDRTAQGAANLTHETKPMKWLIAQELALGGDVQFKEFQIKDEDRIKFMNLAKKYKSGQIDIPEIRKQMGKDWANYNVVLFLEQMGANRDISNLALSVDKRKKALKMLQNFRINGNSNLSSKWVEDSVIASQRIEGIYVPLDAFVEDTIPV